MKKRKLNTRKLINKGKKRGYVTQEEVLEFFGGDAEKE